MNTTRRILHIRLVLKNWSFFTQSPNTQAAYAPRASDEFPRVLLYRPRCGRRQRFCRRISRIRSDLILEILQPMANVVCPSASAKIHPASRPRAKHLPPSENWWRLRRSSRNRPSSGNETPPTYRAHRTSDWNMRLHVGTLRHEVAQMQDYDAEQFKVNHSKQINVKIMAEVREYTLFFRSPSVSPEGRFRVFRGKRPLHPAPLPSSFSPRNIRKPTSPDTEGGCGDESVATERAPPIGTYQTRSNATRRGRRGYFARHPILRSDASRR